MMKRLLELYLTSWVLLLSHAFCVLIGAAVMFTGAVGALEANGVHVAAELAAMRP